MLIDKLTEDFYRVVSRTGVHPSVLWVSFECYRDLAQEMEEKSGRKFDNGIESMTFLGAEIKPAEVLQGVSWVFDVQGCFGIIVDMHDRYLRSLRI